MNPSRHELQSLLKPEAAAGHSSFARAHLNRPITLICARRYNTAKANALREIDFDAVEAPEILSLHLGENQD